MAQVVECLSSKRETNWFKPQYCKKKKKKKKKKETQGAQQIVL
jgi:hypothetical protein